MIEKKFTMLSTKEWLQYFQYKLSSDRDKELTDQSHKDLFLKEALDTLSDKDARNISFQSLSYLISQIEEATGVSESNITAFKPARSADPDRNRKILIGLIGFTLIALIGFGIFYLVNSSSLGDTEDAAPTVIQDTAQVNNVNFIDTSASPLDMLPSSATNTANTDTIAQKVATPVAKPAKKKIEIEQSSPTVEQAKPTMPSQPTASVQKTDREQELIIEAQEKYKRNDIEGAKRILNNLKSYENTQKDKAERILKSIGN